MKYMIYGTGCDNKAYSDTYKDAIDAAEILTENDDWTGDILIYECKPIAKVEKSVKVKRIKGGK